jgi:hypothetical protein
MREGPVRRVLRDDRSDLDASAESIDPETGQPHSDILDDLYSSMGRVAGFENDYAFYYIRFDSPRGARMTAPFTAHASSHRRVVQQPDHRPHAPLRQHS